VRTSSLWLFSVLLFGSISFGWSQSLYFVDSLWSFPGSPVEQARWLLRPVYRFARLGPPPQVLPEVLCRIVGQPLPFSRQVLRQYLQIHNINEADLGGSLDKPLSRANNGNPLAPMARYFIIHDTSYPNYHFQPFPLHINTPDWYYNKLSMWQQGENSKAHVFINRVGESITALDFSVPWRATKYEVQYLGKRSRGLFLHVELIQPRREDPQGLPGNDAIAPDLGFTVAQLRRLALVYLAASMRAGKGLIPGFHAALDAGIPGAHDDPQHFDLPLWGKQIASIVEAIVRIQHNQHTTGNAGQRHE